MLWEGYKKDQYVATIRVSSKDGSEDTFDVQVPDKKSAIESAKEIEKVGRVHDRSYRAKVVGMSKLMEVV